MEFDGKYSMDFHRVLGHGIWEFHGVAWTVINTLRSFIRFEGPYSMESHGIPWNIGNQIRWNTRVCNGMESLVEFPCEIKRLSRVKVSWPFGHF